MQVTNEVRKQQKALTNDFKTRAQEAETLLGEIEDCENTLAALNESLSVELGIGVITAVVSKGRKAKSVKVKSAIVAKTVKANPAVKPSAGMSLKDLVRDFLVKAGKPMKIAEIVQGMQKAGHVFQATKPVVAMRFLIYNNKKMFKRVKRGTFVADAANDQKAGVAKVQQVKVAKVVKAAKTVKPAKAKPVAKKNEAPSLRDSVRDLLAGAGKPMRIAEIVQSMQNAGHVFQSGKPIKAMTKLMYNNAKVFRRVRPGTFKAV